MTGEGRSYWVRHGQSDWNLARLTQGQAMAPVLTALGRSQAARAAELIDRDLQRRDARAEVVRSSDLTRAQQTAQVLAARLGCELVLDARLREQHLGTWEGRPYAETWAAAELHDWSDETLPVAGGESPRQVRERMLAVIGDLDAAAATVLVSHGDAIRFAVPCLTGEPAPAGSWLEVPNGAVARVHRRQVHWLGH